MFQKHRTCFNVSSRDEKCSSSSHDHGVVATGAILWYLLRESARHRTHVWPLDKVICPGTWRDSAARHVLPVVAKDIPTITKTRVALFLTELWATRGKSERNGAGCEARLRRPPVVSVYES